MKSGNELAQYAKNKLGTPYFYGSKIQYGVLNETFMEKMCKSYPTIVNQKYLQLARDKKQVGKLNTDCSGLIAAYTERVIGSAQMYSTAYTRLPIAQVEQFAIGTVLWKPGHVGVYGGKVNGEFICYEAKGINYGTIMSRVKSTAWQYGLTFRDMSYDYETKIQGTWKQSNPYAEPTQVVAAGMRGNDVKWMQWELVEAGYLLSVDGICGLKTIAALRAFQASCKIEVDEKCGPITRKQLLINE